MLNERSKQFVKGVNDTLLEVWKNAKSKAEPISGRALCVKAGYNPAWLSRHIERLKTGKDDIAISTLYKICNLLGYQVTINIKK